MRKVLVLFAAVIACWTSGGYAAGESPAADAHRDKKKMKMDEPMTSGMMKKGMMKGDVKNAADKKDKEMQPMMEQEEKSMSPEKTKQ